MEMVTEIETIPFFFVYGRCEALGELAREEHR